MEHRWQARYVYCAIVVTRQVNTMIKKIPIISNAEKEWGSKAWLQARAINVLHCICVSGYYYHYHYHYHYYCITKQVTSIIKWALIGLAYVA